MFRSLKIAAWVKFSSFPTRRSQVRPEEPGAAIRRLFRAQVVEVAVVVNACFSTAAEGLLKVKCRN